jgi:phage gp29-like protein
MDQTPLEYVRPELFEEAVDWHHRSYTSAVLGQTPGSIRCRSTSTLMSIHQRLDSEVCNSFVIFISVSLQ